MVVLNLMVVLICCFNVHGWTPPSSSTPNKAIESSRYDFIRRMFINAPIISTLFILGTTSPEVTNAAPPFAIMEEELGYFPVKDERTGETVMVPAKAKRTSTNQAIELAKYLQSTNTKMYGAFWCPHCSRQKELFGKEAWKYINYIECSNQGYKSQFATCLTNGIEGYPEWKFGNGKNQGGEMELIDIAILSGYISKKGKGVFDASLETGVPPLGGSCKIAQ